MKKGAAILAAALMLASPLAAQEGRRDKTLRFTFRDASVEAVLLHVSEVTGWIFIEEAPLRGTLTAYSRTEVPVESCLEFLNAALRPHGRAVVNPAWPRLPEPGQTLRVMELAKAAAFLPGVHVGQEAEAIPLTDEVRTQIVRLQSAAAAETGKELAELLRKSMGEGGQISISTHSNSIILTGRSDGVRRAVEILRAVDRTTWARLKVVAIPLKYADAVELAKTLNETYKREPGRESSAPGLAGAFRMMRPGGETERPPAESRSPSQETVRIAAEPRTNSLIVTATDENLSIMSALVATLDCPAAALNTYVIQLRNADATVVAPILNDLLGAPGKRSTPPPQQRTDAARPNPGAGASTAPRTRVPYAGGTRR